jgi:hypothetical protein
MNYAISTFCFGKRYYEQTNRLISSFDYLDEKPDIFIITDNPESLLKRDFVQVRNIENYNPKYSSYKNDYYGFDFSVKRYSLKLAFDYGYEKVILCDTDVVVNPSLFNHVILENSFVLNSIVGPVTYNFNNEVKTNSMLGRRFLSYEKYLDKNFDKSTLNFIPEDCIQYIWITGETRYSFLDTWNECINHKDENKLPNIPCGNIDEMCFSALYNNISVGNNADKSLNLLIAKHDKWY